MRTSLILKMRLLTHNMLTSHVKGVKNGYPFIIEATEVKEEEVEFNPEFVVRMIPRIEWTALLKAVEMLGKTGILPNDPAEDYENDEDFLKKVHHAIMEIEVTTGHLKCPESGRKFPIANGIPNMLLNENDV
ncbi:multifunctional methyltransferase subunit TRM112-like protein [Styela clava]